MNTISFLGLLCFAALFYSTNGELRSCNSSPRLSMERIFGGQDARPMEFPHQASLQMRYLNSHVCGGTLIDQQWVLTAAHCFSRGRSPWNWKIVLGEHNLRIKESNEREFPVSKVIVHERYNSQNQLNDIALIKLERPVDLQGRDSHIKPVCLADQSFVIRTGLQCVVSGYGRGDKGRVITDVLQKLTQPLLDSNQCARVWAGVGWPVTANHVCVGDLKTPKGVCNGDSGGPVQCRLNNGEWTQVGVTSWTTRTCIAPGYAAVFTRVSSYRDWIANQIRRN